MTLRMSSSGPLPTAIKLWVNAPIGRKHIKAKTSATVGVMYPLGKEKVLVTRDQKDRRDISRLGLIGMSYLEARIASLIPNILHFSSLVRANLATQANQLSDALYHVTEVENVSHSPHFICFF